MQARTYTFESELDLRTQLRDKSKEGDRNIILGADDGADDGDVHEGRSNFIPKVLDVSSYFDREALYS